MLKWALPATGWMRISRVFTVMGRKEIRNVSFLNWRLIRNFPVFHRKNIADFWGRMTFSGSASPLKVLPINPSIWIWALINPGSLACAKQGGQLFEFIFFYKQEAPAGAIHLFEFCGFEKAFRMAKTRMPQACHI
jgi:hypothetical protein